MRGSMATYAGKATVAAPFHQRQHGIGFKCFRAERTSHAARLS